MDVEFRYNFHTHYSFFLHFMAHQPSSNQKKKKQSQDSSMAFEPLTYNNHVRGPIMTQLVQ